MHRIDLYRKALTAVLPPEAVDSAISAIFVLIMQDDSFVEVAHQQAKENAKFVHDHQEFEAAAFRVFCAMEWGIPDAYPRMLGFLDKHYPASYRRTAPLRDWTNPDRQINEWTTIKRYLFG